MRPAKRLATVGAIVATLTLLPLSAFAVQTAVTNGDFEAGDLTDYDYDENWPDEEPTIPGWTVVDGTVDLGTTEIAGCTTVDTSDYTTLRGWATTAAREGARSGVELVFDADNAHRAIGTTTVWPVTDGGATVTVDGQMLVFWEGVYGLALVDDDLFMHDHLEWTPEEWEAFDDTGYYDDDNPEDSFEVTYSAWAQPVYLNGSPLVVNGKTVVWWNNAQVLAFEVGGVLTGADDWTDAEWATVVALVTDPSVTQDDLFGDDDFIDEASYGVAVVDGAQLVDYEIEDEDDNVIGTVPMARSSQVLALVSQMWGNGAGYVAHGPAVYSEEFTVGTGRQINITWAASGAADDYHVFGYLLNTETCEQTEVIDATGQYRQWATDSVEIPRAGTYRFVFVSGTYDQTWGYEAGGILYVDDITETPVTVAGAPAATSSGTAARALATTGSEGGIALVVLAGLLVLLGAGGLTIALTRRA